MCMKRFYFRKHNDFGTSAFCKEMAFHALHFYRQSLLARRRRWKKVSGRMVPSQTQWESFN